MLKWRQCGHNQMTAVGISCTLHAAIFFALSQSVQISTPIPKTMAITSVQFIAASPPATIPPTRSSIPASASDSVQPTAVEPSNQPFPKVTPKHPPPTKTFSQQKAAKPLTSEKPVTSNAANESGPVTTAQTAVKPSADRQLHASVQSMTEELLELETLRVICSHRPSPAYPRSARRLRESGVVQVKVLISTLGEVKDAQVVKSSGYIRLDKAALEAVNRWRCQAAIRNGQPAEAVAIQPFHFDLSQ